MKNRLFLEDDAEKQAMERAAQLLYLVFLRVGRDSAAGCALRRALGCSSLESVEQAAEQFGVKPGQLRSLQATLESQLGELSFLSKREREGPN